MNKRHMKISYIRKPMASHSLISLPLTLISLLMAGVSVGMSVSVGGSGDIRIAAWGVCSLLCAVVALGYGIVALLEKEKKYILAKISLGISGMLMMFWVVVIGSSFH